MAVKAGAVTELNDSNYIHKKLWRMHFVSLVKYYRNLICYIQRFLRCEHA